MAGLALSLSLLFSAAPMHAATVFDNFTGDTPESFGASFIAAAFAIAFCLGASIASADEAVSVPLLSTGKTILGQPFSYPTTGKAAILARTTTFPPGAATTPHRSSSTDEPGGRERSSDRRGPARLVHHRIRGPIVIRLLLFVILRAYDTGRRSRGQSRHRTHRRSRRRGRPAGGGLIDRDVGRLAASDLPGNGQQAGKVIGEWRVSACS